jgi:hypothetical protein
MNLGSLAFRKCRFKEDVKDGKADSLTRKIMEQYLKHRIGGISAAGALLALGLALSAPTGAIAGTTSCGSDGSLCSFSVVADGVDLGSGRYTIDPKTGLLQIVAPRTFTLGDGSTVGITGINGNADPVLGFSANANTLASGHSFVFNFDLPISLSGPINANSSISYSLTSTTAAGAEIKPLDPTHKVLYGLEVDTTVGGLDSLNKGVDAGDKFTLLGGPTTGNSPVFTNSNSFIGDSRYDTMTAVVQFSLSPNSNVGMSGFVQQVAVPEPSSTALLLAGLGFVGWVARRRLGS